MLPAMAFILWPSLLALVMAAGIRGTIVYVSDMQAPDSEQGRMSTIGILEGIAQISYMDSNGGPQQMDVPAGQKLVLVDSDMNGCPDITPEKTDMTAADLSAFVEAQIRNDTTVQERDPAQKAETEKEEPDKKADPKKTEPAKKEEPETKAAAETEPDI